MSSVHVQLNKSTYTSGECIQGKAVCQFRSPKQFRKIKLRFKCKEHTQWSKTESHYNSSTKKTEYRTVHYRGDNTILNQEITCKGEGELSSGEHIFPFSFNIPQTAPSSFHCELGDITYSIKLVVDRAFKFDIENEKIVNVFAPISFYDISQILKNPVTLSDEKTVCCWCCAGGMIETRLEFDNRCLTQGKAKRVKVYCLNMSNQNVEEISLKIKQKLEFKATSPSYDYKNTSDTISSTRTNGVGAHGDKTCDLIVKIPENIEIPNFDGCNLFKVEYKLILEAVVSGCHTNLEISTEVGVSNTSNQEEDDPQRTFEDRPMCYAPPGPLTEIPTMPMPTAPTTSMPMPLEGYGLKLTTPYPPPAYPPEPMPSAPWNQGPSAPPDTEYTQTNNELPPPSYNEATANKKMPT